MAGDDNAPHHLAVAVGLRHAPAQLRPQAHLADVPDHDRGAFLVRPHHDILNIRDVFDVAQAPDHVFGPGLFDDRAAHVVVGTHDGVLDLGQRDAVGGQSVGVHHHLVGLDEAADAGHFGHAGHGLELVAQVPVLDAAQLGQVMLAGGVFHHVLKDPAHPGGVGAQGRGDFLGELVADEVEVFQHPGAGPVDVGAVLENDVHQGLGEHGVAPHHLGPGHGQHGGGERVGDLVLHHLGGLAGKVGFDDDLDVGEVGDGVHRQVIGGIDGPGGDQEGDQDHQEAVGSAEINDPGYHDKFPVFSFQ